MKMPLFSRLERWGEMKRAAVIDLGGVRIHDVRPVRRGSATGFNKSGRLVLRGRTDAGEVKIYEAQSTPHAEFLVELSRRAQAGDRIGPFSLPPVVTSSGPFVVASWVRGTASSSLRPLELKSLAGAQAALHGHPVPSVTSHFDYWTDFVEPRFVRAAYSVGCDVLARQVIDVISEWRCTAKLIVQHPDLTPCNLVGTTAGWVVIDNELLCLGHGGFMDVLNTLNALPPRYRSLYLSEYRKHSCAAEIPTQPVLSAFWLARQAGTLFVSGKMARLAELLARMGAVESRTALVAPLITADTDA